MKARILEPQVKVYSSMDENALSIATLQEGAEVEFSSAKRKAGKLWVPITLSTGQLAYIPGETRIAIIREGTIVQDNIAMYTEPSDGSLVRQQLMRNTRLSILQVVKEGGKDWVKVRDTNGIEGYIAGGTRFRLAPQRTKAMGRRSMVSGAMWLIAGLVIVFSQNTASSGSGFNLLGYGALLFGAVMLISGLVQFLTAPA
jgi:hypothetical protein